MEIYEINVVLATTSTNKIARITAAIDAFEFKTGIKLVPHTLNEIVKVETDCIEPYYNYESNAELKADVAYFNLNESERIVSSKSEWLTRKEPYIIIANDSGVELDAFDGWPGVFTKRCGEELGKNSAEMIFDRVCSDHIIDVTKNQGSIVASTALLLVTPLSRDRIAGAPEDRKELMTVTSTQDIIIDGSFCQAPTHVYDICVPCTTLSNGKKRVAPSTIAKLPIYEAMAYGDYLCESVTIALNRAKSWMENVISKE